MHAVTEPIDDDATADGAPDSKPQVRTLLLTDLCDSTQLVEKLGDAAAAELFREHDRLVLGLQQRWHGRLIDRSDGLLLLFERAIDGLGFALDYARGLRGIGERRKLARHGIELRARSGLHVGEVLTWRNSDAAVSFGAKPLEVEGLAKPMAGRLMTLARPGQILLSATAEPLAHRAARELDERGEQLVWRSWGRWRFKGVPQVQEVYEVGEPGIAPLRAPQPVRGKVWRDIPLWRRPSALAAELLLVAGLATGGWFLTRPQPAIAFGERDWVVVADLRNLTGDTLLDETLQQAFRLSLEQSRYVNVLSDLKARDTLQRMRRDPDTILDRAIASEIALRDGARAVILPTVAEVGGRVRVSAEVIDPHTQTTVYAESADGSGAVSTLRSIDKVTAALRGRLGEAMQSIARNSVSLPNVTTTNLDALKSYAIGRKYGAAGDGKRALAYYQRAATLDPQFALAIAASGSVQAHVLDNLPAANRDFRRALALRDRLGPREALKLEVSAARLGPPVAAIERARQLLELYPDELSVQTALGQLELWERNAPAAALLHAQAATVPQSERRGVAFYLEGIALVALERPADAIAAFERSRQLGYTGFGYSHAYAYAMQRDREGTSRVLAGLVPSGTATGDVTIAAQDALFALDRGDLAAAAAHAQEAERRAMAAEPLVSGHWRRVQALAIDVLGADPARDALRGRLAAELNAVDAERDGLERTARFNHAYLVQALGYLSARLDDQALVERAIATVERDGGADDYPLALQMQQVLRAELARIEGDPVAAGQQLEALASRDEALTLVHGSRLRAFQAAGDVRAARAEAQWLAGHRGRAWVERPAGDLLVAVAVHDSTVALLAQAEASRALGDERTARTQLDAFKAAWPGASLAPALQARVAALR